MFYREFLGQPTTSIPNCFPHRVAASASVFMTLTNRRKTGHFIRRVKLKKNTEEVFFRKRPFS